MQSLHQRRYIIESRRVLGLQVRGRPTALFLVDGVEYPRKAVLEKELVRGARYPRFESPVCDESADDFQFVIGKRLALQLLALIEELAELIWPPTFPLESADGRFEVVDVHRPRVLVRILLLKQHTKIDSHWTVIVGRHADAIGSVQVCPGYFSEKGTLLIVKLDTIALQKRAS
jgi:hypothetical protein